MYLNFYGLKEKPFSVTPDSSFLFKSKYHSEAFNHLLYGIKSKEGFILITGDIGTGKTTLCRALLSELGNKTHSALVFNPNLTEIELLRAIIQDLGIQSRNESKKDIIDELNQFLLACSKKEETVVVIMTRHRTSHLKSWKRSAFSPTWKRKRRSSSRSSSSVRLSSRKN